MCSNQELQKSSSYTITIKTHYYHYSLLQETIQAVQYHDTGDCCCKSSTHESGQGGWDIPPSLEWPSRVLGIWQVPATVWAKSKLLLLGVSTVQQTPWPSSQDHCQFNVWLISTHYYMRLRWLTVEIYHHFIDAQKSSLSRASSFSMFFLCLPTSLTWKSASLS